MQRGIYNEIITYNFFLLGLVSETVAAQTSASLFETFESLLNPVNVLESQLRLDYVHITQRVHVPFDVDDFSIIKGTNNLENAIDGTDVGQKRVSETSTCGSTLE
jgi:hypothetical protein